MGGGLGRRTYVAASAVLLLLVVLPILGGSPVAAEVDDVDPTIAISEPGDGDAFGQDEAVLADFTCVDETELATCLGDVDDGDPIDTSTLGEHTFTVVAMDTAGNETT